MCISHICIYVYIYTYIHNNELWPELVEWLRPRKAFGLTCIPLSQKLEDVSLKCSCSRMTYNPRVSIGGKFEKIGGTSSVCTIATTIKMYIFQIYERMSLCPNLCTHFSHFSGTNMAHYLSIYCIVSMYGLPNLVLLCHY